MKKVFLFALLLGLYVNAYSQGVGFDLSNYGVKIEPDKRLIMVLATMEAGNMGSISGQDGKLINTELSPAGKKFRERLQTDLADVPNDLRQKISSFIFQYKKRHPKATDAEMISPFISMAYALTPVPELYDPTVTTDLPGDLLDVLDFAPLVREMYRRTGIAGRLNDYVKLYMLDANTILKPTATEMVTDILGYLHTKPETSYIERVKTEAKIGGKMVARIEPVEHDRRFYIVPEMLAPVGNVTFLNIHDDYFVIVPPDTNLGFSEARRAYIQYVIDALTLTNSKDIFAKKDSIKALLDERRKSNPDVSPDVFLTVTRSLVAAADAKEIEWSKGQIATQQARAKIDTLKTDAEKRAVADELAKYKASLADETAARLSEEYEKGSVLAFYFAGQMKGMEDSGFDIAASLHDWLLSLDTTKENDRLAENAEARKRAIAARSEKKNIPTAIVENPVTNKLLDIQKLIEAKDYAAAESQLKELQKANPAEPRIYYNLGRVNSLQAETITDSTDQNKKLIEAKTNYENVIRSATVTTDPALISLSYVAIARIFEFYDRKEDAIKIYDAAIKIGNVDHGGFNEAVAAKQRLLKDQ